MAGTTIHPSLLKMSFPYIVDQVPKSSPKRKNNPLDWQYITIHNTGNEKSTAKGERAWLTNPENTTVTGFQIVIDNFGAIECIPLNENAWACGDGQGTGNRKSISIEICETGNFDKNITMAAELTATLLKAKGKGMDCIRQHHDWSGKDCPWILRKNNGALWKVFLERVKMFMNGTKPVTPPAPVVTPPAPKPVDPNTPKTVVMPTTTKSIGGVMHIPARAFVEAIGGHTAYWDNDTQTAIFDAGKNMISLTDKSNIMCVYRPGVTEPEVVTMPTTAKLINDTFHVVGRAFVEGIGGTVEWNETAQSAVFKVGDKKVTAKIDNPNLIVEKL